MIKYILYRQAVTWSKDKQAANPILIRILFMLAIIKILSDYHHLTRILFMLIIHSAIEWKKVQLEIIFIHVNMGSRTSISWTKMTNLPRFSVVHIKNYIIKHGTDRASDRGCEFYVEEIIHDTYAADDVQNKLFCLKARTQNNPDLRLRKMSKYVVSSRF